MCVCAQDQVKYVDLHLDQMGFVLENVFSVDECRALISESKRVGYGSLEGEFLPSSTLSCLRVIFIGKPPPDRRGAPQCGTTSAR
jgi:hypothetical protein